MEQLRQRFHEGLLYSFRNNGFNGGLNLERNYGSNEFFHYYLRRSECWLLKSTRIVESHGLDSACEIWDTGGGAEELVVEPDPRGDDCGFLGGYQDVFGGPDACPVRCDRHLSTAAPT